MKVLIAAVKMIAIGCQKLRKYKIIKIFKFWKAFQKILKTVAKIEDIKTVTKTKTKVM